MRIGISPLATLIFRVIFYVSVCFAVEECLVRQIDDKQKSRRLAIAIHHMGSASVNTLLILSDTVETCHVVCIERHNKSEPLEMNWLQYLEGTFF